MQPRSVTGKVGYFSHRDGTPVEFGREHFSYTWHRDGQWTIRAYCEIESGIVRDRHVAREMVYTLDSDNYPFDCFVRLHQSGEFLGTGWFRFMQDSAECEMFNRTMGRVTQHCPSAGRPQSFGAHALTCDATHIARYDHGSSERLQPVQAMMSSLEHDGCSGPSINKLDFSIEYVGQERVSVPAGSFDTDHYIFHVGRMFPEEHPPEEIWCIVGSLVFVKARVGGYMNATFELCEYSERNESEVHSPAVTVV